MLTSCLSYNPPYQRRACSWIGFASLSFLGPFLRSIAGFYGWTRSARISRARFLRSTRISRPSEGENKTKKDERLYARGAGITRTTPEWDLYEIPVVRVLSETKEYLIFFFFFFLLYFDPIFSHYHTFRSVNRYRRNLWRIVKNRRPIMLKLLH